MKRLKNLRLMAAGVAVLASMISVPVFADDNYNDRMIVPQTNNIPQFFIRRIDLTHNQLEFAYAIGLAGNKTISRFGVGWISDRLESLVNADVRTYNFGDPETQIVFWSGNDIISDFASDDVGYFKTYTVDADVDLKSNIYYELFYRVEFTDGEVWMNKVTYGDCGRKWKAGKSCNKVYYINDKQVDNVVYQLEDAPAVKFQRKYTPVVEPTSDPEPTPEPTHDPEPTPEPTPEPEPTAEPISEPEPTTTEPVPGPEPTPEESTSEAAGTDEKPKLIAKVASTVKYATDVTSTNTAATSEINEDDTEESIEDELTEANEGYGDTTLDVPALGQASKCDEFNFWPYIILGFGGGVFLSLVLSYIKKAKDTLSTIR